MCPRPLDDEGIKKLIYLSDYNHYTQKEKFVKGLKKFSVFLKMIIMEKQKENRKKCVQNLF
jgi:hypothetical protein